MRVCFICNEYPPGPHGGIGTFTQLMARALVRTGNEVRVVGGYSADYPAPAYEEDNGVRVWRFHGATHRAGKVLARYRIFQLVARWSCEGQIDLLEAPDWEGWIAGFRLPVPIVVRFNGSTTYFAAETAQRVRPVTFLLEWASMRGADFFCSASQYTADKTQRLFRLRHRPIAILHNPVELPSERPVMPRSVNQVVFTGTLTWKKGVLSLITAWKRVLQVCPASELHIFGRDGITKNGKSMRQFLLSKIENSARTTVHFHGHVRREELFRALQLARVAVFPSYVEAFAIAPMEAMACACPTIYSSRSSGPELMEDEQHGLLVDPSRPEEISESIIRVLNDDDLARRLGEAGRGRIEESFWIEILRERNEVFYRGCIDNFRKRRRF
jgi:glycosyltransferase involved in cell wall biosynthesis